MKKYKTINGVRHKCIGWTYDGKPTGWIACGMNEHKENVCFTYLGTISVEFKMTLNDARKCAHAGRCDDDVKNVCGLPYIKKQLRRITDDDMREIIKNYGVDDVDNMNRTKMQMFVVWLAAGNIVDEY